MRTFSVLAVLTTGLLSVSAAAHAPSHAIVDKVVEQGVPRDAMERLTKFMTENTGRDFVQDTYACKGKDPASIKPCVESERYKSTQTVTLKSPTHVVIIDFAKPSTERRFYLINLKTASVEKYFTSHGVGTGDNYAYRFSNTKDSRQTSLGIYLTGTTYSGKYGTTLRMYGLERSNDQAYNRDIVLHGAWYVSEDFITKINPNTKQPYGRIGVSWGCPAVSPYIASKVIPILLNGSLIMHYHAELQDKAQSGRQVISSKYIPIPKPRPANLGNTAPTEEATMETPEDSGMN